MMEQKARLRAMEPEDLCIRRRNDHGGRTTEPDHR